MTQNFIIENTRDQDNCLDLRYGTWPNSNKFAKYVLFANGRTEWIEKYQHLPADLNLPKSAGFVTWDHRGQGASGGARAMVDTYDSYAQDAAAIADASTHGSPYVVMAHSMGGLISLYATLLGYIKPKALVLSSPLFRLPQHNIPAPIAQPLSKALSSMNLASVSSGAGSHTKKTPFEINELTHHYERYMMMSDSPYPIPGATFGWIDQTFEAIDAIFSKQLLSKLDIPVLVMHGSNETVVDPSGFKDWVQEAQKHSNAEITYRVVSGARHELYSEIDTYYNAAIAYTNKLFKDFLSED